MILIVKLGSIFSNKLKRTVKVSSYDLPQVTSSDQVTYKKGKKHVKKHGHFMPNKAALPIADQNHIHISPRRFDSNSVITALIEK